MENKELITAGLNTVDYLIKYLGKDAIGSDFLNKYLATGSEQSQITEKQKIALNKLIETSTKMQNDTMEISTKASQNNEGLQKIYSIIEGFQQKVEKIEEENNRYTEHFQKLVEQTAVIIGLVSDIQKISSQINVLSFNASIEAAHAGTAGAGFRVIANEVKKLSDSTSTTSDKIMNKVNALQESIAEVSTVTDKNTSNLRNLSKETTMTLNEFEAVKNSNLSNNETVGQITKSISSNVQEINNIISIVKEAEDANKKTVDLFADCASKNQMLFGDFYSMIYEIKAILNDLQNPPSAAETPAAPAADGFDEVVEF